LDSRKETDNPGNWALPALPEFSGPIRSDPILESRREKGRIRRGRGGGGWTTQKEERVGVGGGLGVKKVLKTSTKDGSRKKPLVTERAKKKRGREKREMKKWVSENVRAEQEQGL